MKHTGKHLKHTGKRLPCLCGYIAVVVLNNEFVKFKPLSPLNFPVMKRRILLPIFLLFHLGWNALQAQWTSLGTGITPSSPQDIWSISVVNENTVWAVTFDNINSEPTYQFTRTSDGGETWHPGIIDVIPSGEICEHIWALDSMTAWVATSPFTAPPSGGIYKTTDGGVNWAHQNTAYSEAETGPQVVHFYDANNGFTFGATFYSKFRAFTTSNGGNTWEPASMPAANTSEFVEYNTGNGKYAVVGDKIWFVTNQARVFKSDDRGHNWYVVGQAITPTPPSTADLIPLLSRTPSMELSYPIGPRRHGGRAMAVLAGNLSPIFLTKMSCRLNTSRAQKALTLRTAVGDSTWA